MTQAPRIIVTPDPATLAAEAAGLIVAAAQRATERFCLALSGGSTPRGLYRLLGEPPYGDAIDWRKVHLFFADERTVPPDDPESNFGLVRGSLLSTGVVPPERVHRMCGEAHDLEGAARAYEKTLMALCPGETDAAAPVLDLVLLGIGADGHTASLFPGTEALSVTERWVVANRVPELSTRRLTLTYPVLCAARQVLFLVAGEEKARTLRHVLGGDERVPAARVVADASGEVCFVLDGAAAAELAPE